VPFAVVRLLEAVEVEEQQGDPAPVTTCARRLGEQPGMESSVVENARERVSPGALRELARHPLDICDHAAVERAPRLPFAVAFEHASEHEQLRRDLRRSQSEAFPLPGVILGELVGTVVSVEARDEGRQRSQLAEPAEPLKRRDDAVSERLLDALDREVPCGCPHDPGHVRTA
jgi:hypothetical protein